MIKTQAKLLQLIKSEKITVEPVMYAYEYGLSLEEARFSLAHDTDPIDLSTRLVFADGDNSKKFLIDIINVEKKLVNITEKEFNKLLKEIKDNHLIVQIPNFEAQNRLLIGYYVEKKVEDFMNMKTKLDQEVIIEKIEFKEFEI